MLGEVTSLYGAGPGYQAIDLAYLGERASMLLLVPDAGNFGEFESALDADMLADIVGQLEPERVTLALPRFSFEVRLPLKQLLRQQGMTKAFEPGAADFSGLDMNPLFLSDVLHKTFLRVDEDGTEAAAATAPVSSPTSLPRPLIINRPFVVAIRDRPTGTLLFLGRVVDPR
jgi:serpin B